MKAVKTLPEGYQEILSIDMQKDKKLALVVNGAAAIIMVFMFVAGFLRMPMTAMLEGTAVVRGVVLRFVVAFILVIVYMVLHELVHGIVMKCCGSRKVTYGFTGLYAFAGSEDYYPKKSYILIALAPVVLWGVVLAVVNAVVSPSWFWVTYIVQIVNISGAAGDFYVTLKFSKLPKDILVRDSGVSMSVYSVK